MRIGLDAYTIREMQLNPFQMVDFVDQLHFEGIQFEDIPKLSNENYSGTKEILDYAASKNMYSHLTIQRPNPCVFYGSVDELRQAFIEDVQVCAEYGIKEVRSTVGVYRHRVNFPIPFSIQLKQTTDFLLSMKPILKDYGIRINLETHADCTSWELLRIIETVGEEFVGITLDTGNLMIHGDYPVEAVKRLARYTHLTHAKDGLLRFGKNGLVRQGKAPGQGSIEWEPILKTLKEFQPNIDLSIEDHKVLWYIDIYKQEWYQDHPDVCAYEISQMVRLAKETEEKESQGLIPDMNKYESVPYLEQMNERLTFGRNYLRSILAKVR